MQVSLSHLLHNRVPESSLAYCLQLWNDSPFAFKLRKARLTKVGDFTCRHGEAPQITVNEDLHPYLFLITYIHEVAHLHVHKQFGRRAEAHGEEWKAQFRFLMQPVLTEAVFPTVLIQGLNEHLRDPAASTFSDSEITKLLRSYDPRAVHVTLLSDIPEGSVFALNGRWFKKGKVRRTRALCKEMNTGRTYLVPVDAPVQNAQLSLL